MANPQILVVEDEGIIARSIQSELQQMGYNVPALASTGEEALRQAAATLPDLVLMDIALQGSMDGVETSQRLRAQFDIPVVYLTAYADERTLQRAKITEPYGYLLKPYEERELRTTIEIGLYKHRLEQRLHEVERRLDATLRSIGDAVLGTDALGTIKLMNAMAETLTGWSREKAEGQGLHQVFILKDEHSRMNSVINGAFEKGTATDLPSSAILVSKDGMETPIEGTAAPIYGEKRVFAGLVLAFRDISRRKEVEMAVRDGEDRRRRAEKLEVLTTFAGGVADEFNNKLSGIIGGISVATSALPKEDPNRSVLATAEAAAWEAAAAIKKMLAFSGRTKLQLEITDLNAAVEKTVSVLQGLMPAGVQIEFRPGPRLAQVRIDPGQINEVVVQLCLNARDGMPGGGRIVIETLDVALSKENQSGDAGARPGHYVCLRVTDHGTGVKPEVRSRVFEPFFTTKAGKATGLGLALVFGIVQLHGGWVECSHGEAPGARFDVFLPPFVEAPEGSHVPAAQCMPLARGHAERPPRYQSRFAHKEKPTRKAMAP